MAQAPQRIAGRYELSALPLDGGGMGLVWEGYDTVLDRPVAIKQIRDDASRTPEERAELVERFRREAKVTAKIEHPGVPVVYDAAIASALHDGSNGSSGDGIEKLYLVMQLIRGQTLADLLAERGPLPLSWAAAAAAQICSVLSHAHAVPVVHRDLKPSNVMIDEAGRVIVLDFGVAAVLSTDVTRITSTGAMVGTRDYMSPEQFHGVGVSPRSDLYAVGCVLHETLSGDKVFDGSSDPALQHVYEEPLPLRTLRPEVPGDLEELVLDLLAKAPEDRPGSAQEVYERLVPHLPASGTKATAGPALRDAPDPTRPYRQPLAPRPRPARPTPVTGPAAAPAAQRISLAELGEAEERAYALLEEERPTQAVGVLEQAIAAAPVGPDHPRLLYLREMRAAALLLGGDHRRALAAFQQLIAAWSRREGAESEQALDYRRQAALCLAAVGDTEAALAEYRALLGIAEQRGAGHTDEARELRRWIGDLLLAAHRIEEAARVLRALHRELAAVYGPEHPETREVRDVLGRIDRTSGTGR